MTQPQDKMRAEFEAFVKSEGYDLDLQTDALGGRYIKGCAGFAWDFWQAACAQQSAQSQQDALDAARYRALRDREDGVSVECTWNGNTGASPYINGKDLDECADSWIPIAAQGASNV